VAQTKPDLNPIENLWKNLKIAVHCRSSTNLTEPEKICREEWRKIPKSRCAKLMQKHPPKVLLLSIVSGV
jgi:transposase